MATKVQSLGCGIVREDEQVILVSTNDRHQVAVVDKQNGIQRSSKGTSENNATKYALLSTRKQTASTLDLYESDDEREFIQECREEQGENVHSSVSPPARKISSSSDWTDMDHVIKLWKLKDSQVQDMLKLKVKLTDIQHRKNTASDVVRFYLSSGGNLHTAERKFRNMIQWRKKHKVDELMASGYRPPQPMIDNIPGAVLEQCDREGNPIFIDRSTSADMIGLIDRYGAEELVKHAIWLRESMVEGDWIQEFEARYGRPIQRIVIISDLQGLNRHQHLNRRCLSVFGQIMRLDQDNYPEVSKRIITINTPGFFRFIWSLVKPFFDASVVAKMEFHGNDFRDVLSELVELTALPSVIVKEGTGRVFPGMPAGLEGGPLRGE